MLRVSDTRLLFHAILHCSSEVHMLCEVPLWQRAIKLREEGLKVEELQNIKIVDYFGNSSIRRQLMKLPVAK